MSTDRRTSRRDQQAAETRRLILDAARRLFAAQGFAATSITQIADEAGVAVPTIYASVGTKLRLLELLNDRIDEVAGTPDLVAELLASSNPAEVLALQIRLSRRLNERAGDLIAALRSAATAEPAMTAPYQTGIGRHHHGMRTTARLLAKLGGLRAGLSPEQAAPILDLMLAPDSWTTLTTAYAMTWDQAEALVTQSLSILLLRPPTDIECST